MNSYQRGIELALIENSVAPDSFSILEGMAKVASENQGVLGRYLAKTAYEIMIESDKANSAPANHFLLISKQSSWCPQYQDAVDCFLKVAQATKVFHKQADVSDILAGGGSALKGLGYGSLLAGSGVGTLAWLLGRHTRQDNADIEGLKYKRNYYQQLSNELHDEMKRKYDYDQQLNKTKKK